MSQERIELKHTPLGANAEKPNTFALDIPPVDLMRPASRQAFIDLIETLTEHFVNRFDLELSTADGKKINISGTYTVTKNRTTTV